MSASFVIVALANDGDFDTRAQLMERGAFEVLPKESIETHGRAIFARAARVAALEGQNRELREQALSEFSASWPSSFRADLPLREIERRYIAHVLKSQGGVQESAAKVLGIDRKTLYRRRKEIAAVEGGENG
jgi:DNA-binding NtrC family response regulator